MIHRVLIPLVLFAATAAAAEPRCLLVSSYHPEYEHDRAIERGLTSVIEGRCELKRFYMDTKRRLGAEHAERMALEAKALIEQWRPDVVIASDDNASRYLVMPHFRDAELPFVFCGINDTVEPYGYPYRNATGVIEVSPVEALLDAVLAVRPKARRGVFLAADVPTQRKFFPHVAGAHARRGIAIDGVFVASQTEWEAAFLEAQGADYLFVSNSAGIEEWDEARARRLVGRETRVLTVTSYPWMAGITILAMAKVVEEQGELAGQAVVRILDGESPAEIPIAVNRRQHLFINPKLLRASGLSLPAPILNRAVPVE